MNFVEKFSKVRVMVVGDVMLDRYWWGTVTRISPEAPVPVVRLDKSSFAAGGAANVALNIAGLGAEPVLIGTIGDDLDAESLIEILSAHGISNKHLVRLQDQPTTVKTRVIAHSQQVVRIDHEETSDITADKEADVWSVISEMLPSVDAVVVSDYAKGLLTATLLSRLVEAGRSSDTPVFVDPKGKYYSKYRGATLITPNRREAAEACNFDEHMPDLVNSAGKKLLSELGLQKLLITEGENGLTLFQDGDEPVHLETAAKEIYDVTGAGDTVIASLAVAIASGMNFLDAAKLANLAAGIVVEQVGTTIITLDKIKDAFESAETAGF